MKGAEIFVKMMLFYVRILGLLTRTKWRIRVLFAHLFLQAGYFSVKREDVSKQAYQDDDDNGYHHIDFAFRTHYISHFYFLLSMKRGAKEAE
jgi:hypothetical protein